MTVFKITGYKPFIGNTSLVVVAPTRNAISTYLRNNPPDSGGFINYSVDELEEIPATHKFVCPHCNVEIPDPSKVITLS
jgi:hypothetical protein